MSTLRKQKSAVGEQAEASQVKVNNQFPIVGIGASAGGLDPIRKLLENLPTDTGMAFVVIQHLATGQESMLPEILSRATQMSVLQVKDGMKVQKNQVYVITPGTTMTLKNGFLKLVPKGVALKPINDFFISLASERKTLSIGVVLSGTGNDGTEGLKAIKAEGGITFVQDPETAQYNDMPRNAIDAETAYFVLSPENIVKEIVRIIKNPKLTRAQTVSPELAKTETPLKKIISILKTAFGVDFTHYKETTINRRLTRRMVINKIENDKDYVAFLRANPNELGALFDDLLIGVTSFFREPKTFEALKEKVFPELIKNRSTNENIRVWVPGCSTGEEVYSLAIAIQEFLEEKALANLRVQIFGTDANEKNIEKARLGLYPKAIEDNVSESRLKRFFSRQNGNYQIKKLIREMCIFAKQDITNDPPFSNLDLIMCRNVLIYFDSLLHERVFPIFHYGLKDNGFLIIGESESIGKFSYLFEPVTTKGLIFRKKRAQPQGPLHLEAFASYSPAKKTSKQLEKPNFLVSLKEEVDSLLIAEYAPASLLVNSNLEILVFRGQVNPYLTHEPGTASLNVAKIVQKELRTDVQTIIYRARKENKALKETVQFKHDGQQKTLTIKVNPLKTVDYDEPFFLVTFQEKSSPRKLSHQEAESKTTFAEKESDEYNHVQDLKEDLESTKQSLQTIIEVQEATNEELRSTMEEAQSSNEELQSTNEELETAKEELQSGNEELQTLNEELKNRNLALGRLNDDLANLQANMDVPVVIVDNDLKIRRFTESALEFLRISPSDVGRLITGIKLAVHIENLEQTISDVITKLRVVTQEIEFTENHWCEMRVRPYLTAEKKIDGAVLSFIDLTEHKKSEQALRRSEKEYSSLFANMTDGFAYCQMIFDDIGKPVDFVYLQINEAFERITGLKKDRVVGKKVTEAIPGIKAANPEIFEVYGRVAFTGQKEKFEIFFKPLSMWLSISVYSPSKGYFAAIFEDITERKKIEQDISMALKKTQQSESEISALLKAAKAVLKNKEFPDSARAIFDACKELIGATAGYVALLSEDGKENVVLFLDAGGLPCTVDPSLPMPIRGLRGEVYNSGKVVFENDFPKSEWQKFSPKGHVQLKAVLFAPLTIENSVVGVIGLANKTGGFTKRDAEMAMAFGELASVALVNSQMLETLEEKEKELTIHSENLEALVEERTRQLKDSERLTTIGATAGMVGHDIRNPLQAITSDVYLVKTELASTLESKEKRNALESLQEIEKNIDYINKIVQDLQDFARPLSPHAEKTDLKLIVDEMLTKNGLPENVKVSVNVEPAATNFVADSTFINRIMYNLVNNAVQAMPNGGRLTIHAYKEAKDVVITVEDTGVGIPEQVKGKLFTPMFTTKAKGQGFGLAVIKRMTEALDGTVTFESQEGKGTKFIIRLPPPKELNGK